MLTKIVRNKFGAGQVCENGEDRAQQGDQLYGEEDKSTCTKSNSWPKLMFKVPIIPWLFTVRESQYSSPPFSVSCRTPPSLIYCFPILL